MAGGGEGLGQIVERNGGDGRVHAVGIDEQNVHCDGQGLWGGLVGAPAVDQFPADDGPSCVHSVLRAAVG